MFQPAIPPQDWMFTMCEWVLGPEILKVIFIGSREDLPCFPANDLMPIIFDLKSSLMKYFSSSANPSSASVDLFIWTLMVSSFFTLHHSDLKKSEFDTEETLSV